MGCSSYGIQTPNDIDDNETMDTKVATIGRKIGDYLIIIRSAPETFPTDTYGFHLFFVGLIDIHFEQATQDINLSELIADTNIIQRKSILYMKKWPKEIEESKILFIPLYKNGER